MIAPAALTSIGECMIELSGEEGERWRMGFAGDTFNTAWYARISLGRLGRAGAEGRVAYATLVGEDAFSDRMLRFFTDSGVAADRVGRVKGRRPGLYAITLQAGERTFTYWRGESAARLLADDPAWLEAALGDSRMLYLSGITLAILDEAGRAAMLDALARRRASGSLIAFDPNYRPALWADAAVARAWTESAYAAADIALPGRDDDAALFGESDAADVAARISRLGPTEIVVKDGARPGVLLGRDGIVPVTPDIVEDPVDTTGAGDSFNGAYLAARLAGREPLDAVRFGQAVAAEVVRHHGALVPEEKLGRAFETGSGFGMA